MWLAVILLAVLLICILLARNHILGIIVFKERPAHYQSRHDCLSCIRRFLFGFNAYRSRISLTPADMDWDYSEHTVYSEDGICLKGWCVPQKPCGGMVLLINWLGGCKSDNLTAAEVFLELGYSVFLLDLRGHGDSDGMETSLGYYEYRDVLAGIEYVKALYRPGKLLIYGVSMGAVACMRAFSAAEVVGVDALVLEAPYDRLINAIRNRVAAMRLPVLLLPDALALAGWAVLQYNPYKFNPVEYASDIKIPVMLIHRRDDRLVKSKEVEEIFQNLQDKNNSELLILDDCGHGSILTSHRDIFAAEVRKFLSGI